MNFREIALKISQVGQFIPIYGPIFQSFLPSKIGEKAGPVIASIEDSSTKLSHILLNVQVTAEKLRANGHNISGMDKLDIAMDGATQIISDCEALRGSEIIEEVMFREGVKEIVEGWNKVIKSVKKK